MAIAAVANVALALIGGESVQQRTNGTPKRFERAGLGAAQQRLELGKHLLNRVEVRAVRRQVAQRRARTLDVNERDALVDMDLSAIQGMLLGDKGFIRTTLKEDLARQGIDLQMPLRSNMKESRPSGFLRRAARARRLVKTAQ